MGESERAGGKVRRNEEGPNVRSSGPCSIADEHASGGILGCEFELMSSKTQGNEPSSLVQVDSMAEVNRSENMWMDM